MPHPIAVDQPASGRLGDGQHPPVHMVRHALHHELGRLAQPLGPVLPHQLVVAADAAGGDDDRAGPQRELTDDRTRALHSPGHIAGLEDRPAHAVDRSVREQELVHAVPELEGDQALLLGLARPAHERLEHARPGAPGDVKSRYGIAVAEGPIPAALGPSHDRKPAHPLLMQPRPCLTGGKSDVGLCPLPRPVVFLAVEAGRPHPVVEGKLVRVFHAQPALFGSINQEQAAQRPERLAAQALLGLLVDDDHPLAGVGQLGRGNQTGQAAPHDDHVRVVTQARLLTPGIRPRGPRAGIIFG